MPNRSSSKKTWRAILIAAIAICGVLAIALIGGAAYFVTRHVDTQFVSEESADAQFASARQRLAGQTPLIELRAGDEPIIHRAASETRAASITVIRALAYSRDARKLVNLSVPLWLFRLSRGNHFSFLDDAHFDSDRVRLTLEDLERHGPGLILDETDLEGARILIWAE